MSDVTKSEDCLMPKELKNWLKEHFDCDKYEQLQKFFKYSTKDEIDSFSQAVQNLNNNLDNDKENFLRMRLYEKLDEMQLVDFVVNKTGLDTGYAITFLKDEKQKKFLYYKKNEYNKKLDSVDFDNFTNFRATFKDILKDSFNIVVTVKEHAKKQIIEDILNVEGISNESRNEIKALLDKSNMKKIGKITIYLRTLENTKDENEREKIVNNLKKALNYGT